MEQVGLPFNVLNGRTTLSVFSSPTKGGNNMLASCYSVLINFTEYTLQTSQSAVPLRLRFTTSAPDSVSDEGMNISLQMHQSV